jgi:hypothetical protein
MKILQNRKIKYLMCLLLLLVFVTALYTIFTYKKSIGILNGLKGVYITDVRDNSAVISWVTSEPTETLLFYSSEELSFFSKFSKESRAHDVRDNIEKGYLVYEVSKKNKYYVHSVQLKNLEPETHYNFAIKEDIFLLGGQYIDEFKTLPVIEEISSPKSAYGKVFNQEGSIISDTLILARLVNNQDTIKSQQISYLMDGRTGWSIDFSNLYNEDLSQIYNEEDSYLELRVVNSSGETKKIIDLNFIRPTVSISVYDNGSERSEVDIKGALIAQGSIGEEICGMNGLGNWSGGSCRCVSGASLNSSTGVCICNSGYLQSGSSCIKYTPPPKKCSGPDRYENSTEICVRSCNNGNWSSYSCTRKAKPIECVNADTKSAHEGVNVCHYVCIEGVWEKGSCEPPKPKDQPQDETKDETFEICTAKGGYSWCICAVDYKHLPNCVSNSLLYSEYLSSCPTYCRKHDPNKDTEDKGENDENECTTPECDLEEEDLIQEDYCLDINFDKEECKRNSLYCEWSGTVCRPKSSSAKWNYRCPDIRNSHQCELLDHCEYKEGSCKNREFDTSGYINVSAAANPEICTGVGEDKHPITQGTNMEDTHVTGSYHVGHSACSVDLAISVGTPLWNGQIEGYSLDENGASNWEENYNCEFGTHSGYGCYVDVKNPNGKVTRYAHLDCDRTVGCSAIYSGASGNSDPGGHLHVEVVAQNREETNNCRQDYNPCNYLPGGCYPCNALHAGTGVSDKTSSVDSDIGFKLEDNLTSKTHAAEESNVLGETDTSNILLDYVEDSSLEEGTYVLMNNGNPRTRSFVKTSNNNIVYFSDDNQNGILDEDESILSQNQLNYRYNVTYSRVADSFELILERGLNLVSFPIIFKKQNGDEIKTAKETLEYLNSEGADVTMIATYRDGVPVVYVNREGKEYGEGDFNILPGEGYFLLSNRRGIFRYSGYKVDGGLEILLQRGWNLVNFYNSNKSYYTAFNLIQQIKNQSIPASALSKWESGRYNTVIDEAGDKYGVDFNVYPNYGYFVRIDGEGGRFIPK